MEVEREQIHVFLVKKKRDDLWRVKRWGEAVVEMRRGIK